LRKGGPDGKACLEPFVSGDRRKLATRRGEKAAQDPKTTFGGPRSPQRRNIGKKRGEKGRRDQGRSLYGGCSVRRGGTLKSATMPEG